jgi:hypothetical protein
MAAGMHYALHRVDESKTVHHSYRAGRNDCLKVGLDPWRSGEVDSPAGWSGANGRGPTQFLFRCRGIPLLVSQLVQRVVPLDRIESGDLRRQQGGLIEPAAEETRRFEVILEQVIQGLEVPRVQLNCFFEVLARFPGVTGAVNGLDCSARRPNARPSHK